jgi:hypothetical protein
MHRHDNHTPGEQPRKEEKEEEINQKIRYGGSTACVLY